MSTARICPDGVDGPETIDPLSIMGTPKQTFLCDEHLSSPALSARHFAFFRSRC